MKAVKVGILGIGNVAKGTYRTLELNCEKIKANTGVCIEITKILNRNPEKDRGIDIPQNVYVTDPYDIINDSEIDIVVELIGGIEPATEFMAASLSNRKHVVTANKAAIAKNGHKLQKLAEDNHVMLRFEASVAGGIPIINAITTALLSNEIDGILGIMNGTTNYILTQMTDCNKDYESVLRDAQEKGFAERDPSGDVKGYDVANKLSILMSLIFGVEIQPEDIPTQGITDITKDDIDFATHFGYKIKLLAAAGMVGNTVECNVQPALVSENHPLASVNNEFNAIFLKGNAVDDLMFYGKGAGPLPTGSAVMGDIIEIAKAIDKDAAFDLQPLLKYDSKLKFTGEGVNQYYIRMTAADMPGVLGNISSTFGKYNVGIESMIQNSAGISPNDTVPLIFIVYEINRTVLDKALNEILSNKYAVSVDSVMRVER